MSAPSKRIIHGIAASGGATAAALPAPADIIALQAQEVMMVVKIGKAFGVTVDKAVASSILTAAGCTVVGAGIFEAANVAYPFSIPAKAAIAVGVIEVAGNLVYDYFDSN